MQHMISQYKDLHAGSKIAVLGSSPTLNLFNGNDEEISIAANGAAHIVKDSTYFICYSKNSPQRDWFYLSNPSVTRIIAAYLAPFDQNSYPEELVRKKMQSEIAGTLGMDPNSGLDSYVEEFGRQVNNPQSEIGGILLGGKVA